MPYVLLIVKLHASLPLFEFEYLGAATLPS
jgi:hypothetical protein